MFDVLGISQVIEWGKEKLGIKSESYHSDQIKPKKYSFRPQTLTQYIGQERAKELININLQKIREIKHVHFIISGSKGTGKSTLAYIIANELGFEISTYVAGSFTQENLVQFLSKNQDDKNKNHILFIDEIHGIDKSIGEFMYPLLEDFLLPVGNIKVKPFIFIGCTTNLEILQKKLSPMIDRCSANVNLSRYDADSIKKILKQYNEQLYQLNIDESDYDLLAVNTRFTPRIAISYFDDFVVVKDMKKVLNAHQVVKDSLTTNDIIVLKHILDTGNKPTGVEVLGIITQQTKQTYMEIQEPFLIQMGYMSRTSRGRILTSKGEALVRSLDEY
jgi:Holliday junction DNA helicase RuvB